MPYAPTLNVLPSWLPVPRIEVVFSSLPATAKAITLYRYADNRTMPVRGGVQIPVSGAAAILDFEAPNGVPATYRAEMFSDAATSASLGFTDTASATLLFDGTCVHQPLDPSLNVSLQELRGTGDGLTRKTPGEFVFPESAELPVFIGGTRQGLSDVPFVLLAQSLEAADRMQSVFGVYNNSQLAIACIRVPPPMRVPRTFFAAVQEMSEQEINLHAGGQAIQFSFSATEAMPPAPGLVSAPLRRKDIDAAYATRAARAAAYSSRLARDRDYNLAGLAG